MDRLKPFIIVSNASAQVREIPWNFARIQSDQYPIIQRKVMVAIGFSIGLAKSRSDQDEMSSITRVKSDPLLVDAGVDACRNRGSRRMPCGISHAETSRAVD